MRERVVTLDGEFKMTSSPDNGTQISVRIQSTLNKRVDLGMINIPARNSMTHLQIQVRDSSGF